MITKHTITGASWTAITAAGEDGTCWLDDDNTGSVNKADCRIYHSASGAPNVTKLLEAKKVYKSNSNSDVMSLGADSENDIYYARCKNTADEVALLVDAI
jgi:hypothetical protein